MVPYRHGGGPRGSCKTTAVRGKKKERQPLGHTIKSNKHKQHVHYHERKIATREREDGGVRANSSVEKRERERKSERVEKRSLVNKCCRRQTDTQR